MTATAQSFHPPSNIKALLDQLYDVKFSKHTPLVVVLLSMIYTVYRTRHYLGSAFALAWPVAWPTAVFIELLVLAASAATFIALRNAFLAELKKEDQDISRVGVYVAMGALLLAFVALLFVAWADAWLLTGGYWVPTLIMTLIQAAQMLFMMLFIIAAILDERETLRDEYATWKRGTCPYCGVAVSPNNRARHVASCTARA